MGNKKTPNFHSNRFILKYLNSFPNDRLTTFFKLGYDGQSYAGNVKKGKAKRNTRVSIMIPKDIANNNLKFMSDWEFFIVGVRSK